MDSIGRYKIEKELGRGAMGAVYKALDPQIDRTVAIKVILTTGLSPKDLENYKQRFHREARAAGKMSHGNIVTIYDITEDATGQPYLVMEFVEGRTLDQVMGALADGGETMLTAQALDIGIQVADALDYAHRRGVVHRDVKPANILLTDEGVAKIADFGIAKMEGVQLTQTGHMLGTPAFMSPEQFSGGEIDARSDLFSLGSILYWLLSGQKPFHADTLTMVTYKVVFADPPPPTQVNPALPKEADLVLARCLAKKPESRYASCKDLAEDLRALVVGKPVKATALPEEERTVITPAALAGAAVPLEKTASQPAPNLERTVATPPTQPATLETTQAVAAQGQTPATPVVERTVAAPPPAASAPASVAAQPAQPKKAAPLRRPAAPPPTSGFFTGKRIAAMAALLLIILYAGSVWKNRRATAPDEPQRQAQSAPQSAPDAAPSLAPPPEPVREASPEVHEPEPAPASRTGKGVGKGRRGRAGSAASGPKATLRVECYHNFRDGILEITTGDERVLRATLRGEEQDLGVVKIYNGIYRGAVEIPAGETVLRVRVQSRRSNYDESDEIGGSFAADGSRTLLIEFGRGSGIKVVNRRLTLRWK